MMTSRQDQESASRAINCGTHDRSVNRYDPSGLVTILTTTSPILSHPSVGILSRAIESLSGVAGLKGCRHIIVCDGADESEPDSGHRYALYKQRLHEIVKAGLFETEVELVECPRRVGLAGAVLAGAANIDTPYVFMHEHDWEVVRPIDVKGILSVMAIDEEVKHVRLNKWANEERGWDFVIKEDTRRRAIPLLRTLCWSSNPHFAKMSYYRDVVLPRLSSHYGGGAECFEVPLYRLVLKDVQRRGFDRAHEEWGLFIYGQLGDPAVVTHLDGRRSS